MKNIILIIGAPRSGTTLLSGLVTGNDECFPNIPECTFLTQIIEHYFNIVNYSDQERFRVFAQDKDTLKEVYKRHINNMLSIILNQFEEPEYKYLILKDPELTTYIDLIPDFFHNTNKIIFIVRDPRAIVSSMLKVELKKENSLNELNKNELIEKISKNIFNYYYIVHQSKMYKDNQLCIINYENIINNENNEFLKLEEFIGYKISRRPFERNYFSFDQNDPTYSKNYGKSIIKVESDFRDILSIDSIKLIEDMFSGYNLQYHWWK